MPPTAAQRLRRPEYFGAMMVRSGDADMLVSGIEQHYADSLRVMLETIGPADGVRRMSSYYLVLLPREVYVLADCAVNIDPAAEDLAETALLTARMVRVLGHRAARGDAVVLELRRGGPPAGAQGAARHGAGEGRGARAGRRRRDAAGDGGERRDPAAHFRFSDLEKDANVLIFPDLQSGNLALHLLQHVGEAVVVGPVLTGTRLPAQLLQYGSSVQDVVNLAAVGAVQAVGLRAVAG